MVFILTNIVHKLQPGYNLLQPKDRLANLSTVDKASMQLVALLRDN